MSLRTPTPEMTDAEFLLYLESDLAQQKWKPIAVPDLAEQYRERLKVISAYMKQLEEISQERMEALSKIEAITKRTR